MGSGLVTDAQFHVLAVDDSLIDRKLIERLLKISSFQVTAVKSGSKALEILGLSSDDDQVDLDTTPSVSLNYHDRQIQTKSSKNNCPAYLFLSFPWPRIWILPEPPAVQQVVEVNLIITDYCMPGMTGYELLRKIKESKYFRDIPVVIMSSENVPSRINRCLEEGAEDFFLKPVQMSDVNKLWPYLVRGKANQY